MTQNLIDMAALAKSRERARKSSNPAMFLHERAADQISERLEEVNRPFTDMAIVTGFPEFWGDLWPQAKLIREAEVLEIQPKSHDLIVHAMSLHCANDPVGQMIQCLRGLRPDGMFLAVLFGGQTLQELRIALTAAEEELTGGISPRVLPMAEIRDLGGLLQRTGFALPVADNDRINVTYSDAWALFRDLRAMGEVNVMAERLKVTPSRRFFGLVSNIYKKKFTNNMNNLDTTFELIFLTGWAPSDNQQKPLKPGSATTRLADVLGAVSFEDTK